MKVRCANCDWQGDEDDCTERSESMRSEFWGQVATHRYATLACPQCGSEEIDDPVTIEGEDE